MMPAFATVTDLEQRWHALTSEEKTQAQLLLADASALMRSQADTSLVEESLLTAICCSMVKRALSAQAFNAGVTQTSQNVGGVSESFTFANPTGDLYLSQTERKALGIGRQTGFTMTMGGEE